MELAVLVAIVVIALAFDYTNGFHDAANAIATSVSTRALTPRVALLVAAVANFAGALTATGVASTVGKGIITPPAGIGGLVIVGAGLIGAISWNLVTWYLGLPSSSSHALIGGLIGAAVAAAGLDHVMWHNVLVKVVVPMVVAPLIGLTAGFLLMLAVLWIFRRVRPAPAQRNFRRVQTLSATFMAYSHGTQDAQKTMGVITLALVTTGHLSTFDVPLWVVLAAAGAISLGTYSGGWRIMRTLGRRVIEIDPARGFAAETTAATVLTTASHLGYPLSTTHVITSSIMGVGATRRLSAVRWGIARSIGAAWVLTIPMSALVGAVTYLLARLFLL